MVSNVTGQFKSFAATVETNGDDMSTARVNFTADVDSISTNNEQRDAHLKAPDFFDSANHPKITFTGEGLKKTGIDEYEVRGVLTMRGISKEITLKVEYGGIMQDPWGNTRTGFVIGGKLNRKDFGVSFGMLSETGGALLGDEVTLMANAEFVKEAASVPA
jgi:polyisoprenoid-binding protein YceI